jgi:hypothetical protein
MKGGWIVVVAAYITQQVREFIERCRIESSVFFEARACTCAQLVEVFGGSDHTNDRHVELAWF